uniref:uncharacterized protein n=1 Tax=Myxine glutinosa TaxID=7769 RepID=UPI00358F2DBF
MDMQSPEVADTCSQSRRSVIGQGWDATWDVLHSPSPGKGGVGGRRKREFIPDDMKDISYWDKRRKNNEAAKRSREKRRLNDLVLEGRVVGLLEENSSLRAELSALRFRFGLAQASPEPPPARPTSLTFAVTQQPRDSLNTRGEEYASARSPWRSLSPVYLFGDDRGSHDVAGTGNNEPNSPTTSNDSAYGSSASEGSPIGMASPPSSIANAAMAAQVSVLRQTSGRGRCCSPDGGKKMSLPHKLRFKMATTCDPPASRPRDTEMAITGPILPQMEIGGSRSVNLQCGRNQARNGVSGVNERSSRVNEKLNHSAVTINENETLRSELDTLSAEVAQLKWLFTEGRSTTTTCRALS